MTGGAAGLQSVAQRLDRVAINPQNLLARIVVVEPRFFADGAHTLPHFFHQAFRDIRPKNTAARRSRYRSGCCGRRGCDRIRCRLLHRAAAVAPTIPACQDGGASSSSLRNDPPRRGLAPRRQPLRYTPARFAEKPCGRARGRPPRRRRGRRARIVSPRPWLPARNSKNGPLVM